MIQERFHLAIFSLIFITSVQTTPHPNYGGNSNYQNRVGDHGFVSSFLSSFLTSASVHRLGRHHHNLRHHDHDYNEIEEIHRNDTESGYRTTLKSHIFDNPDSRHDDDPRSSNSEEYAKVMIGDTIYTLPIVTVPQHQPQYQHRANDWRRRDSTRAERRNAATFWQRGPAARRRLDGNNEVVRRRQDEGFSMVDRFRDMSSKMVSNFARRLSVSKGILQRKLRRRVKFSMNLVPY